MATKREFGDVFINEVGELLKRQTIERMDRIAIQTHNRLTLLTPWDTGYARANWNFTLNHINTRVRKRDKEAEKENARLGSIYRAKKSIPNQYASSVFDVYNITNAVPYIIYLNEGSSEKAPVNFVEIEAAQAVKDIEMADKGIFGR